MNSYDPHHLTRSTLRLIFLYFAKNEVLPAIPSTKLKHQSQKRYPNISLTLSTKPLSSRSMLSTSASCSNNFRCSRVSDVGVTTLTETNRSPFPRPPN